MYLMEKRICFAYEFHRLNHSVVKTSNQQNYQRKFDMTNIQVKNTVKSFSAKFEGNGRVNDVTERRL